MMTRAAVLAVLAFAASAVFGADPFTQNIRPTEPLSPREQAKTFHLPPGFKIELVAGDPDIGKPMNIAFDHRGRLWVTSTTTYPFPSPADRAGKDTIKVITFNEDGSTKSIDTFAEGLNIPVGIVPYKEGCLAFSIPNITYYRDTDGDGKSDKAEPFYGPFDFSKDTHGMSSNYVRGFDGWIYGCHGFANDSTVKGRDGRAVHMFSGNTYRFRPDGSHIEVFTHGQTNPFGMCQDPLGNLYTSDSHSKPIYSLLRGGYYESLHPKHDGLGFAPAMMQHLHNSTAIASVIYYAADHFPPAYRDNLFVGNVVTSRINRDSLTHAGSSPVAKEEEDFVRSDDPWFRPIQIKLGPDGALYVSDFYNRIIGHYEVPLDDPRRDYARGRVWRISYDGPEPHAPLGKLPDFTAASVRDLVAALNHPNLVVRTMATDEMVDRAGAGAVSPLKALLEGAIVSPFEGRHALWALHRLGALEGTTILDRMCDSRDAGTRVQCMRILAERGELTADNWGQLTAGLQDSDAMVRRAAADAMGRHPSPANVRPLLDLLTNTSPADTHLIHVVRMALRDQLRASGAFRGLDAMKLTDAEVGALTGLAIAVPTAESAGFLTRHIDRIADRGDTGRALRHAAQHVAPDDFDVLAGVIRGRFADDTDLQMDLLSSIRDGLTQRGAAPTPALRAWALELAATTLRGAGPVDTAWSNVPLPEAPTAVPWTYEQRRCADGVTARLLSSLPRGEQLTGTLRSRAFTIPPALSFYLCGHTGDPRVGPSNNKSRVRLVTADTREVLAETSPPRSDQAQLVTWQLAPFAGRSAYIEVTDGDTGGSYAWVAFGRLDPAVVPMPPASPSEAQRRQQDACLIAGAFGLNELAPDLSRLLASADSTADTRMAAARALAACGSTTGIPLLTQIVVDPAQPEPLREQIAGSLASVAGDSEPARGAMISAFRGASAHLQLRLATHLAATATGANALLDAVAQGNAPAAVLFDPAVVDRLGAANIPDLKARVGRLTRGLAAPDDAVRQTIANRVGTWRFLRPDPQHGAEVFAKNCAVCHQIDGKGTTVGPQLDGIGNRGLDRVVEDILDPNRNVDPAFRYETLRLADGTVLTALPRRDNGDTLTFTDSTGKELTISKSDVTKRSEGRGSLMPSNFADALPDNDFYDLVAYLMSHKAK
jgi:putative heme-binding domain-containing protein